MERSGTLLNRKYRALLVSTLAMTASTYLSGILDSIMVGRILGTAEVYAINLTSSIIFLRAIPVAISTFGGNTLSVIHKSKRDSKSADVVFTLSFLFGFIVTSLMAVFGAIFAKPTADLLAQNKTEVSTLVLQYLYPLWAVTPLVAIVNQTAAYARTDGMRKLAISLPIVSNAVNLICDYVYMKIFGWGLAGAGWATFTGYTVGCIIAVYYFRAKDRTVHFVRAAFSQLKTLGSVISVGLPSALIYVCNFLRLFFVNAIILSSTGIVGGKIASVSFSLNSIAFIFVEGASMTLLPILGALYGEKDTKGQRITLRYAMIVTLILSFIVAAVSMLFPKQLASLYGFTDPEAIGVFSVTFRLVSLNIPVLAVIYVMRSFFQATKQKGLANLLVMLDGFLTVVPLMYWFSKYNIYWLWAAFPISKLLTLTIIAAVMIVTKKARKKKGILGLDEPEGIACDFSIKNEVSQAIKASEEAMSFCESNGVPENVANMVGVTVEELCHNIAAYSSAGSADTVDVCVRILDGRVNVRIRDSGREFDPTYYIDNSGRQITGLELVRKLSSDINYNRILGFNVTNVTISY